jgi:sarcosine oxidase subunit gamma
MPELHHVASGVAMAELPLRSVVRVQALYDRRQRSAIVDSKVLPLQPNTCIGNDPFVLWKGPADWLVYSTPRPPSDIEAWLAGVRSEAMLVTTDISSAVGALELTGPSIVEVLLRDCTLDLEGGAIPPGACAQTELAHTKVMIHRPAGSETWRLFVERPVILHVWEWLVDTSQLLNGPLTPV